MNGTTPAPIVLRVSRIGNCNMPINAVTFGGQGCYLQDFGGLAADLAERVCQTLHQGAEEEG